MSVSWERSGFTQVCRCTLVYVITWFLFFCLLYVPPTCILCTDSRLPFSYFSPLHLESLSSCLSSFLWFLQFTGNDFQLHKTESERRWLYTWCLRCLFGLQNIALHRGWNNLMSAEALLFHSLGNEQASSWMNGYVSYVPIAVINMRGTIQNELGNVRCFALM